MKSVITPFLISLLFLITVSAFSQDKVAESQLNLPPSCIVPNFHPASCGWLTKGKSKYNEFANGMANMLKMVMRSKSISQIYL